jgi:diaminopimelate decarboxylase
LNVGEIKTIERIGKKYPGSKLIVRINPDIGSGECDHVITAGRHTKFGIPVEDLNEVIELASKYSLSIVGLH